MVEVGNDLERGLALWSEGLRAKVYGEGASFGRKEFDVLLGDFDVRILPQPLPWLLYSILNQGRIGHTLRSLRRRAHESLPGRESRPDQPRRRQMDGLHASNRVESDAVALLACAGAV